MRRSAGYAVGVGRAAGRQPWTRGDAASRCGAGYWPSIVRKMPAAMTVPMTPARFGPMANISR